MPDWKNVDITYHARLKEVRGLSSETVRTRANDLAQLYAELRTQHRFSLTQDHLRVAVNHEMCAWTRTIEPSDHVAFIPPVAGG